MCPHFPGLAGKQCYSVFVRAVCGLMPLAPQAFEYLPLPRQSLQNPFTTLESFKAIVFSCFYRENRTSKKHKGLGPKARHVVRGGVGTRADTFHHSFLCPDAGP